MSTTRQCQDRRPSASPDAGYTLIEVLVAFVIVAATAQLALMVFGDQAVQLHRTHDVAAATRVADSVLATIDHPDDLRTQSFPRQEMNGLWWEAEITEADQGASSGEGAPVLFRIEVRVFDTPANDASPILDLETRRVRFAAAR